MKKTEFCRLWWQQDFVFMHVSVFRASFFQINFHYLVENFVCFYISTSIIIISILIGLLPIK